jgi:hypothetical protein
MAMVPMAMTANATTAIAALATARWLIHQKRFCCASRSAAVAPITVAGETDTHRTATTGSR